MLGVPVAHDDTLEAEFGLQDAVEDLGVLAAVRVVDSVNVSAFDLYCRSSHTFDSCTSQLLHPLEAHS